MLEDVFRTERELRWSQSLALADYTADTDTVRREPWPRTNELVQ